VHSIKNKRKRTTNSKVFANFENNKIATMITDTQIRRQLLKRIQQIPSNKLNELNEFVSKLELNSNNKDKILSFAGAWENLDTNTFIELTENLIDNRQRNKRRNE
jgi:regulator of PEP synthase PpsR (kinase-PPPase family)